MDKTQDSQTLVTKLKDQRKELLSFYVDVNLVNDLDDFIHNTKKVLPIRIKKKLSRTSTVNLVLRALLNDYLNSANDRLIYRLIIDWKNEMNLQNL